MTPPMTEQEFLNIWLNQKPIKIVEPEYRLYYDDNGFLLYFTTEDLSGNYIVVDQETYLNGPKHIKIVKGKIIEIQTGVGKKLIPAELGQACHPTNVCVIVDVDQPHTSWQLKHEEPTYE
jgi:hypothetical protein